jgi:hypothetical protein
MINIDSLLAYYENHPDYTVKPIKNNKINIEFVKSNRKRKNVLVELYRPTGRFYLNKEDKWVNIRDLEGIFSNEDVMVWIEKDSELLK